MVIMTASLCVVSVSVGVKLCVNAGVHKCEGGVRVCMCECLWKLVSGCAYVAVDTCTRACVYVCPVSMAWTTFWKS